MLPLKEKDREWKKACMDALESIGRKQYLDNIEILENYRMVNNELLYSHYIFTESVTDLAQQSVKEFDLPPYLRHYDIIGKVVKRLSGEFQARPDIFRIAATDEFSTNEYLESKKDLLMKIVMDRLQAGLQQNPPAAAGGDPNAGQPPAEGETPDSVETYMKEKYRSIPEEWGEMILKLDKQRFNTPELEMVEFEDMLISDRAYRHFYLKANGLGYGQETWNPIRVFWHKSPDVKYVEDGDYVGRVFYLSVAEIVNRYGHKMRKQDLEDLYGDYLKRKKFGGAEYSFFQATNVPFENYPEYARTVQAFGFDPHTGVPYTGSLGNITNQDVDVLFNSSSTSYNLAGLTLCTEGYWRSQKRVGFLIMKDPDTGEIVEEIVDENFIVPDFVKEVEDDPTYEDFVYFPEKKMNTVRWTWINTIWGGTKVNVSSQDKDTAALYIDVKELPFQFKGDTNPYECKLPVCGTVFNNRNAKSMSMVALMKPYQIMFNVFMNKIYHLASVDMGKFLQIDPRMIPNDKNLGGERGLQKLITSTKETQIMQIDTSPGARAGSTFNQFTVQDLSQWANIEAAIKVAGSIEQQALFQIGITMQSLGMDDGQYTAEGVRSNSRGTQYLTESWFTRFSNYLMRVKQMNLDIAQYCSATNRDMTISLIQDDMQRAFMNMNGTDLLNSQLGVRVFTSQELIRQTEMLKELVLKNNTSNSPLSSLAEVIYTQSPARIIEVIKKGEAEMQKQVMAKFQQDQQLQGQKAQLEQQSKDKQNDWQAQQNELDRETAIREKIISQVGFDTDTQGNNKIDVVGIGGLELQKQKNAADVVANQQAHTQKLIDMATHAALEKQKLDAQKEVETKKLAQQDKQITADIAVQKSEANAEKQRANADIKVAKIEHAHDIISKNKDLEIKNKDIQHQKIMHDLEKKSANHKVDTEKKLHDIKLTSAKALNRIKIAKAKRPTPKK